MKNTIRINTINNYLKKIFKEKTVKLTIDGGFTCPNRDGSKGFGGCSFCSSTGSGEFTSNNIHTQIQRLSDKWPKAKYLAYLQNHTNTYGSIEYLSELYHGLLAEPLIEGLIIGTRPDCISDDVLQLLKEIHRDNFMWLELGLQTKNDVIAKNINRMYETKVYDETMHRLTDAGIPVVTHVILGLPGEDENDMKDTIEHAVKMGTWGIKLHLLNIVKGSPMEKTHSSYLPFESIEHYVNTVVKLLTFIPENVTIHRLTADAHRKILISPPWSYMKRTILNGINNQMISQNLYQGMNVSTSISEVKLPSPVPTNTL